MHRVKLNKKMYNTHKNYLGILIYQHINDKLFFETFFKTNYTKKYFCLLMEKLVFQLLNISL